MCICRYTCWNENKICEAKFIIYNVGNRKGRISVQLSAVVPDISTSEHAYRRFKFANNNYYICLFKL